MKQKTLRCGSHCVGLEGCRYGDPPQAENPASRILFIQVWGINACRNYYHMIQWKIRESNRVTGWMAPILILHRMGVMPMKHFDFKDMMSFGMFILALLTFVFTFTR